ncbi:hypothetical protein [Methylobacterium sp. J-068]|uniref:hypothetical protein n=1 Tax=Methylobacterium sp. J-068 TaxID=2836649 RepID=UPI001FB972E6|nr:hypothetical protein [Methylobacterium sp. J-068]MCJ2034947.1 hypothetical protein [Methylobacterium sp. J-068]
MFPPARQVPMQLYHPILVPSLVEAWVLDRLRVEPTGDRDRPSLRFFRDHTVAAVTAQAMQDAWDRRAGLDRVGPDLRLGAVLAFERATLSSATQLVSVRETRDDLREDESELRARSNLVRFRERVGTIHLDDEEIDVWLAAYANGHPDDDGTGRWTEAVRAALKDLYRDPRRIPADLIPPSRGR